MKQKQMKRSILSYTMHISAPAEEIFPLLCPVREYDWIPQWQCRLIYSKSGYAEPQCVFQTDFKDGFGIETWIVSDYERHSRIGFVRTGKHRITRYQITLESQSDTTSVQWYQEITCLTETGEALVAKLAEGGFNNSMTQLEKLLSHYLATGTMLHP